MNMKTMKMALALDVAILGEPDSGKATFLVLLYAAQIRYSEFSANKDSEFRFYINPNDIEKISSEYNRMQMGNWPSDKLLKMVEPISFLYGRLEDSKTCKFFNFFKSDKEPEKLSVNFLLFDFGDQILTNVLNNKTMAFMNLLPKVNALLSSEIIVLVIDSSKLHEKEKCQKGAIDIDSQFITTLSNISRFRRKNIYPIIVFSKVNSINKRYLSRLKLPKKVPAVKNQKARNIFAERIMANQYPNTLEYIKNNRAINYIPNNYIFPSIETVKKEDGKVAPALKLTRDAGYVLDCSYSEFIYFIRCLEKISERIEND